MSHVDDGELTAYADGAYPVNDPVALRIGEHLSTCGNCRTRLEQSESLRARASEILAYATPLTVQAPAFETLQTQAFTTPQRRHRAFPLSWAASIILAVGLGWFGRGAVPMRSVADNSAAETAETPKESLQQSPIVADQTSAAPAVGVSGRVAGRGATADAATENAIVMTAPPPPPPSAAAPALEEARRERAPAELAEMAAADLAAPQIPGLPVSRVEVRDGVTTVEQTLPDGKLVTLTIVENVAEGARLREADMSAQKTAETRPMNRVGAQAAAAAPAPAPVVVRRAAKTITINANLSPDSLRALAEKIK